MFGNYNEIVERNKKCQKIINDWFETHDFQNFKNWFNEDVNKPLLDLFKVYFQQQYYKFEMKNVDWNYQLRLFINNNKQRIFDKFKDCCKANFNDYCQVNNMTSFNETVKNTFNEYCQKELPKLSADDTKNFLSYGLNLSEIIYDKVKDQYSSFKKSEVVDVINSLIKKLINENKSNIEKFLSKNIKQLNKVCKTIIKNIKKNFNSFITKVKFDKEKNGTFYFQEDDTNFRGNEDNSAGKIIEYVANHRSLLQQLAEINLAQIEKENNINMSNYLLDYYYDEKNYDKSLQTLARNYLLELNKEVMNKRVLRLERINDDDKIGKLSISINFNPYKDTERSAPVLILEKKVLIGNFGESHSSLKRRLLKRVTGKKYCYAYLVGRILFINKTIVKQCNFTIDEIITAVKKDGRLIKIYELPEHFPGKIRRLAKKCL